MMAPGVSEPRAGQAGVDPASRKMRPVTNIVLAGVGGQGSVLATRVLARAAELAGHDVVTSEVHGMSQRGGTVVTTVRYGDEVLSSAIPEGEADVLVAFERLEAARHLGLVRPGGAVLVNDQRISPSIEALRFVDYPDDLPGLAAKRGVTLQLYPALRLARELGNDRLASTIMLGALSNYLFLGHECWREAVRQSVPPATVVANEVAFETGAEWLVGSPSFSF
jgi:indolepyruvate ferredoxin oxidoreductase, beta subunit